MKDPGSIKSFYFFLGILKKMKFDPKIAEDIYKYRRNVEEVFKVVHNLRAAFEDPEKGGCTFHMDHKGRYRVQISDKAIMLTLAHYGDGDLETFLGGKAGSTQKTLYPYYMSGFLYQYQKTNNIKPKRSSARKWPTEFGIYETDAKQILTYLASENVPFCYSRDIENVEDITRIDTLNGYFFRLSSTKNEWSFSLIFPRQERNIL